MIFPLRKKLIQQRQRVLISGEKRVNCVLNFRHRGWELRSQEAIRAQPQYYVAADHCREQALAQVCAVCSPPPRLGILSVMGDLSPSHCGIDPTSYFYTRQCSTCCASGVVMGGCTSIWAI